ncbi:hypothetical protein BZG36_05459 [Bifiguratus adelaidae]|uniref:Cytochrome P450 n=1 Tax=Bifiguratus adelaidae TaxID=1938954 RepID=A0A261XT88_9FUNG|nr:hypothetical protein BZG36_05459 [Bifiguratus adelaidae]
MSLLSTLSSFSELPHLPDNVTKHAGWYIAGAAATLVAWRALTSGKDKDTKDLPHPPTRPILGNVHLLAGSPLTCFDTWGPKLGPIYQFYMGSLRWIIVKYVPWRGANYSSRASGELRYIVTHGYKDIATARYGDDWRKRRRYFMDATVRKLGMYQANIDAEAEHLVKGLRATKGVPVNPGDYMMLYTYNVIMGIMFDLRFDEPSDPWIREEVKLQEQFFQLTSFSTNLSNYFPFLRLFPQKWVGCRTQDGHEWRAKFDERMEIMFEKLRKRIVDGENVQSFCAELLEREKAGDIDHYELLGMCTSIIGAGVDTTANTLNWWILSMANHPDIQAKVYEEICTLYDNIDTCPKYEDARKLPYLDSTIREAVRLYPAGPLGVPHVSLEDDVYEGYRIPGGTTIIFNSWAMNRDPRKYPNPSVYNPDRYANVTSPSSTLMNGKFEDRDHTSFGFGRRACPGTHLAESELTTATAALLWAFEFVRKDDALIDTEKYRLGLTLAPLPYKFKLKERRSEVLQGKALSNVFDPVDGKTTVVFEDGTTAEGDLVIGCDAMRTNDRSPRTEKRLKAAKGNGGERKPVGAIMDYVREYITWVALRFMRRSWNNDTIDSDPDTVPLD